MSAGFTLQFEGRTWRVSIVPAPLRNEFGSRRVAIIREAARHILVEDAGDVERSVRAGMEALAGLAVVSASRWSGPGDAYPSAWLPDDPGEVPPVN